MNKCELPTLHASCNENKWKGLPDFAYWGHWAGCGSGFCRTRCGEPSSAQCTDQSPTASHAPGNTRHTLLTTEVCGAAQAHKNSSVWRLRSCSIIGLITTQTGQDPCDGAGFWTQLTLESSSRLSGLMSRWMKPSWWMESMASTVSEM